MTTPFPTKLERITEAYYAGHVGKAAYDLCIEETRAELRQRMREFRPSAGLKRYSGSLMIKSIDSAVNADDPSKVVLYASVFSNVDRQNEVITPGAFKNLAEFERDGLILVNHDLSAVPVGMIDSATQDAFGLRVEGRFHTTAAAQEVRKVVRERIAAGKSVKCSIGYQVDADSLDKIGGRTVRRLDAIRIYECSIVNIPANELAGVVSA